MRFSSIITCGCFFFMSCTIGDLNDPSKTVSITGYSIPPKIESIEIGTTNFDITISSRVQETGDLIGYYIYLTNVSGLISSLISGNDLNDEASPNFLLTNTVGIDFVSDNTTLSQKKTITGLEVQETNDIWYMAVTIVGSNSLYGSLQDPAIVGFIESSPSEVVTFQLRRVSNYTLENEEVGSGDNGLDHTGTSINAVSGTSGDFYLHLATNAGSTNIVPFFSSTSDSIASLGYMTNFTQLSSVPTSSSSLYFTGSAIPVVEGHVYAVYNGSHYYKFQVTSVPTTSSTAITDSFTVDLDVAYVPTAGSRSF